MSVRVLRVAEEPYVPPRVGDPYPPHPLSIVARLFKGHNSKLSFEDGSELEGCPNPKCRPFIQEVEPNEDGRYPCSLCPMTAATPKSLHNHVRDTHGAKTARRPKGPIQCSCGATLAQMNAYAKHRRLGRCGRNVGRQPKRLRQGEVRPRR